MLIEVLTDCINCSDQTVLLKLDRFGYLTACEGFDAIDATVEENGTISFNSYISKNKLPFRLYNNVWVKNCSFLSSSPVIDFKIKQVNNEVFMISNNGKILCFDEYENRFYFYDDLDYACYFKFLSV
jgi:hypothetical protein